MTIADVLLQMRAELGFQADFTHILVTMALLLLRILPTIILTPMIGGEASPVEVKLGLALIIALVIFPTVADPTQLATLAETLAGLGVTAHGNLGAEPP